jgi:hypothetical protein
MPDMNLKSMGEPVQSMYEPSWVSAIYSPGPRNKDKHDAPKDENVKATNVHDKRVLQTSECYKNLNHQDRNLNKNIAHHLINLN